MENEIDNIIKDILENEEFQKLKYENHHGITRYEHVYRVTKKTYDICKFFKMKKIKETTRAALLHDFYLDSQLSEYNSAEKLNKHANKALENSLKYFKLSKLQQDIIKSHMFPCNLTIPKYKESWLVTLVDKNVAAYEMLKYKVPLKVNTFAIYLITLINIITYK